MPIPDEQKDMVVEKAGQVSERVSSQITSQIGIRAAQAGEQATTIADALRAGSSQLEDGGQQAPANMINMAADRVEELGQYLSAAEPSQIVADVEDFCRQQPWVVIAGGIALGFVGAASLKRPAPSGTRSDTRGRTQTASLMTAGMGTVTKARMRRLDQKSPPCEITGRGVSKWRNGWKRRHWTATTLTTSPFPS